MGNNFLFFTSFISHSKVLGFPPPAIHCPNIYISSYSKFFFLFFTTSRPLCIFWLYTWIGLGLRLGRWASSLVNLLF
jgi:hypothetical protein